MAILSGKFTGTPLLSPGPLFQPRLSGAALSFSRRDDERHILLAHPHRNEEAGSMGWSYDSKWPQRDTSVSVEDEVNALFGKPEPLPWRHKFVRLWRFLARR